MRKYIYAVQYHIVQCMCIHTARVESKLLIYLIADRQNIMK